MLQCISDTKVYAKELPDIFEREVGRLVRSGAIGDEYSINAIFRAALENIAGRLLLPPKALKEYRNLLKF